MRTERLPHLETFSKAAEFSSFTAAAQALGLTQAAVSQRIHSLERTLGAALFRRQGGHVMLSEAGQRLYPYAQRILALHREARQKVTGKKTPLAGELSLAASSIPGEHLLPRFLQVFRKRNPRIQVRATVADTAAVLSQVERGEVQLGLVGAKRDRPYLEFRPFACDRMALVVPARHALGCRKQVSLKELCEQPLILREAGSGSRWCLEEALSWAGKSAMDLRVALELGSNEGIKEAVLRGIGLAVLSTQAVAKELRGGQLRALRVRDLCLKRKMFVVWDRRRVLSIPARLFLDLVELHAVHCHKQLL